jgi:hypothetical protein
MKTVAVVGTPDHACSDGEDDLGNPPLFGDSLCLGGISERHDALDGDRQRAVAYRFSVMQDLRSSGCGSDLPKNGRDVDGRIKRGVVRVSLGETSKRATFLDPGKELVNELPTNGISAAVERIKFVNLCVIIDGDGLDGMLLFLLREHSWQGTFFWEETD